MARPQPDPRRYRRYVEQEFDNVLLYRRLADESEGEHRQVLLDLAAAEERHARYWQEKLADLGLATGDVDEHRPTRGTRLLSWLARRLGVRTIVPLLERLEASERGRYGHEPDAAAGMKADELVHAQLVAGLFPAWRSRASGSLRAAVFGLNDGLVSNLALVMGMAGGNVHSDIVLLAGLAGLAAGAGSMAAGEYISVRSQRELLEGNRPPSPEELRLLVSEGTVSQLELLMRLRGLDAERASEIASRGDQQAVAEAFSEGEPDLSELGSPAGAAVSSFVAFASGAALPVIPFIVTSGGAALMGASVLAGIALFAVGSTISLLTNRPLLRSGLRQLLIGALTAAGTYLVGLSFDVVIG
ncbi:MAG: VIT1/CCC1 transporter family protein [Acidimicrobiia bacterium]